MCVAKRENDRTPFGQRLLDARTRAGLKQIPAAAAIGIGQSALAELEKKGQGSSYTVVMARVYGCDAHWLATGEGDPAFGAGHTDEPSPSEWAHLREYREASKDDRAEIDALTAKSAEKMRALRREVRESMGLPAEAPRGLGSGLPIAPKVDTALIPKTVPKIKDKGFNLSKTGRSVQLTKKAKP